MTDKQKERMYAMRRAGKTLAVIGAAFGIHEARVCVLCRRAGVARGELVHTKKFLSREKPKRDKEIISLHEEGVSSSDISRLFGISRERVGKIVNGPPIPLRAQREILSLHRKGFTLLEIANKTNSDWNYVQQICGGPV